MGQEGTAWSQQLWAKGPGKGRAADQGPGAACAPLGRETLHLRLQDRKKHVIFKAAEKGRTERQIPERR